MASKRPATRRVNSGKGHRYVVDGVNYAGRGVTTLLGDGVNKPALIGWAARVVAEAAVDELDVWLPMLREGKRRSAVEYLKQQRWETSTEAAARGTEVHSLAAQLAAGQEVEVSEVTEGLVDAYLAFRADWQPTDELSEVMVVNRTHVYAGTLDLICTLEGWRVDRGSRPARVLIDLKTGASGVYPEVALQLAAYRYAEVMLPDLEGDAEDEQPMPQVDHCAVLWLLDDGSYQLKPVQADERAFRTFLYAAELAAFVGRDGWGRDTIGAALQPPELPTHPQKDDPTHD